MNICNMSDELRERINKAIEIEKVHYVERRKVFLAKHKTPVPKEREHITWSNQPITMDFLYLRVSLEAGKQIGYNIHFGFTDAIDEDMEAWDGEMSVDLSDYADELKVGVINALVSKFFLNK